MRPPIAVGPGASTTDAARRGRGGARTARVFLAHRPTGRRVDHLRKLLSGRGRATSRYWRCGHRSYHSHDVRSARYQPPINRADRTRTNASQPNASALPSQQARVTKQRFHQLPIQRLPFILSWRSSPRTSRTGMPEPSALLPPRSIDIRRAVADAVADRTTGNGGGRYSKRDEGRFAQTHAVRQRDRCPVDVFDVALIRCDSALSSR